MRGLALAAVVSNVAIVVTGGIVRITGSGLGCPEWPTCEGGSIIPTGEAASTLHQSIEFGNRLMTGVVGVVVVLVLLAVRRSRPDLTRLGWLLVGGVGAQAVLGGITVRLGLDPLIVAGHFLASMLLIAAAVALHVRASVPPVATRSGPAVDPLSGALRTATSALVAVAAATLVLGTLVTASGPHAGDPGTPRLGLDIRTIAVVHADTVWLLVGLSVAVILLARVSRAQLRRPAGLLAAAILAQGALGYIQYALGIPALLVALHMLGACLVWIAVLRMWLLARG